MKEIKQESKVYEHDDDWRIEIVIDDEDYEAWLWHKDYGIKSLMFGCPKEQQDYDYFLELVEFSIPDYIEGYLEEYGD